MVRCALWYVHVCTCVVLLGRTHSLPGSMVQSSLLGTHMGTQNHLLLSLRDLAPPSPLWLSAFCLFLLLSASFLCFFPFQNDHQSAVHTQLNHQWMSIPWAMVPFVQSAVAMVCVCVGGGGALGRVANEIASSAPDPTGACSKSFRRVSEREVMIRVKTDWVLLSIRRRTHINSFTMKFYRSVTSAQILSVQLKPYTTSFNSYGNPKAWDVILIISTVQV